MQEASRLYSWLQAGILTGILDRAVAIVYHADSTTGQSKEETRCPPDGSSPIARATAYTPNHAPCACYSGTNLGNPPHFPRFTPRIRIGLIVWKFTVPTTRVCFVPTRRR